MAKNVEKPKRGARLHRISGGLEWLKKKTEPGKKRTWARAGKVVKKRLPKRKRSRRRKH